MHDITDSNQQAMPPQDSATSGAVRWLLRVRGPVLVEIMDGQRRRVGPIREEERGLLHQRRYRREEAGLSLVQGDEREEEEGDKRQIRQILDFPSLFEISIPGVTYNPGRTFTWVSLNQPDTYTFRLLGRTAGAVDIYWTGFSDTARLNTTFFHAIPMTARDLASFEYNTLAPSTLIVTVTRKIDNSIQQFSPVAILDPAASQDETPPTTSIAVRGNEAVVSASDNPGGSGILRTLYTTDLRTFSVYSEPFPIPPDARLVMAFSTDRNGNQEYPGAVLPVLGLSQKQFVFRARVGDTSIVPQQLRIVNLDPVPLTGSLEWTISTDIPWLTIEPTKGITPGVVSLSPNIVDLQAGTYTGTFIVTSPTPEVIFAEQAVSVELILEAGATPPVQIQ
jgi:hypothetical protein